MRETDQAAASSTFTEPVVHKIHFKNVEWLSIENHKTIWAF